MLNSKVKLSLIALATAGLGFTSQTVRAGSVDFTLAFQSQSDSVTGVGTLVATDNGNGTYTATSGTMTVLGSSGTNGVFDLAAVPAGQSLDSAEVQGGAVFTYDDVLYPKNDPTSLSPVDGFGLLFEQAQASGAPVGVSLFANSSDTSQPLPTIYFEGNYSEIANISLVLDNSGPAGGSSPVPLPASAGVGFSMLAGFGGLATLRKRLARRAAIV